MTIDPTKVLEIVVDAEDVAAISTFSRMVGLLVLGLAVDGERDMRGEGATVGVTVGFIKVGRGVGLVVEVVEGLNEGLAVGPNVGWRVGEGDGLG